MHAAEGDRSDRRREDRHRDHCSHAKRSDVEHRGARARQRERRQHTEEVRAARDTMQHAHAERRVSVSQTSNPRRPGLHVNVIVRQLPVLMVCWTDVPAATERPEANRDERRSHEALAPRREDVDRRQQLPQQNAEQRDDDHAGGVTEPPRPSSHPALATPIDCERRNRGEMIGTGQHVKQPGDSAGEHDQHGRSIMAWLSSLGSWLLGLCCQRGLALIVPEPESRARSRRLLRRHTNRAIEPDDFAVQHLVLEDVPDERGVFLRASEAGREGHLLRQRNRARLREALAAVACRRCPGAMVITLTPIRAEFAGDRQRQGDDAALGCGVRGLTDLTVEGGDRRRVHDHAALATFAWCVLAHRGRSQPDDVERADEIDLNDAREVFEGLDAFSPEHPLGGGNPGSVDQTIEVAELLKREADRGKHFVLVGDVGLHETRVRSVLRGLGASFFVLEIEAMPPP